MATFSNLSALGDFADDSAEKDNSNTPADNGRIQDSAGLRTKEVRYSLLHQQSAHESLMSNSISSCIHHHQTAVPSADPDLVRTECWVQRSVSES